MSRRGSQTCSERTPLRLFLVIVSAESVKKATVMLHCLGLVLANCLWI